MHVGYRVVQVCRRLREGGGEPILMLDQNRGRWDQVLIRRGLAALARSEKLGGKAGPYADQAAIAACHARARTADETAAKRSFYRCNSTRNQFFRE